MKLALTVIAFGAVIVVGVVGCNPAEPLPPGKAREFTLVIMNTRFIGESPLAIMGVENPDIVVQVGDRVRITIKNKETQLILHDFKIANHDVGLAQYLRPDQSATVEFTPQRVGEFTYYDPLHASTMYGRFIVLGR
ncbi:MAG: cupredoxin domain-containing protein [Candidatus Bipolaricaulota bacterium]|nr:cupredoxin domain-containing protein [Candidatus Bipolaricaulota bacterium]